ncbi:SPOR domain-containing protein [Thermodesulfobacteriota bacterium]
MTKKEKDKPKKNAASPSPVKGRALWVGLTLFACVWMFVLGILVGRGTAPVQFDIDKLQKELVALKEAVVKKERLRFKIDSEPVRRKTDMDFYENLTKTKSNARDNDNQLAVASQQDRKPLLKEAETGNKQKTSSEKVGTAEAPKSSRPTTPAPAVDSEQQLTIQVASLRDPKIADRMVARLKDKWYPAYRAVAEVPGKGTWYRVRIGSFKGKTDAKETLERLKKDNISAVLLPR